MIVQTPFLLSITLLYQTQFGFLISSPFICPCLLHTQEFDLGLVIFVVTDISVCAINVSMNRIYIQLNKGFVVTDKLLVA